MTGLQECATPWSQEMSLPGRMCRTTPVLTLPTGPSRVAEVFGLGSIILVSQRPQNECTPNLAARQSIDAVAWNAADLSDLSAPPLAGGSGFAKTGRGPR